MTRTCSLPLLGVCSATASIVNVLKLLEESYCWKIIGPRGKVSVCIIITSAFVNFVMLYRFALKIFRGMYSIGHKLTFLYLLYLIIDIKIIIYVHMQFSKHNEMRKVAMNVISFCRSIKYKVKLQRGKHSIFCSSYSMKVISQL